MRRVRAADAARVERFDDGCMLHLGDCVDVLPRLGDVDAVITDPPYEQEAHTKQRLVGARGGGVRVMALDFDPITDAERALIPEWATSHCRGWVVVFCQLEAVYLWKQQFNRARDGSYRRAMIWVKPDYRPQFSGDRPAHAYEALVLGWYGRGRSAWSGGGRSGVLVHNKRDAGREHLTQKPIDLMIELVELFTRPGDLVADPFMGSGSTGVAAIRMGRRFVGVERDPRYFDVACRRIDEECRRGRLLPSGTIDAARTYSSRQTKLDE